MTASEASHEPRHAAAPDMLASLREVLVYFDAPEDGCFSDEALARARAAVARAVGAA